MELVKVYAIVIFIVYDIDMVIGIIIGIIIVTQSLRPFIITVT